MRHRHGPTRSQHAMSRGTQESKGLHAQASIPGIYADLSCRPPFSSESTWLGAIKVFPVDTISAFGTASAFFLLSKEGIRPARPHARRPPGLTSRSPETNRHGRRSSRQRVTAVLVQRLRQEEHVPPAYRSTSASRFHRDGCRRLRCLSWSAACSALSHCRNYPNWRKNGRRPN